MTVTYTPPLMEQIKARRVAAVVLQSTPVVVFLRSSGGYVRCVDPKTRNVMDENQQFAREGDTLRILPRWQFVKHPDTLEVGEYRV